MSGNTLHWAARKTELKYANDAVYRAQPALWQVPVTFEDPNVGMHEAYALLGPVLEKMSRDPNVPWVLDFARGAGTLRPVEATDGVTTGNWVVLVHGGPKYTKAYGDFLGTLGDRYAPAYEEDGS
jgi:hypothetical protein